MCNEEKNEFQEELKEKLEAAREEAEDLIRGAVEDAEEIMEDAMEAAEDAKEAFEDASEESDDAESTVPRFIHRTANGFEVDTSEIEKALQAFGEKISEAVNSVQKGVQDSLNAAQDENYKGLDIESLMPFMSKEDCGVLFEKSLEANDKEPGVDGKLYLKCVPYVDEAVLSKLVDRYVAGGFENIRMDNIYPYLSSADVKRIFYYELNK